MIHLGDADPREALTPSGASARAFSNVGRVRLPFDLFAANPLENVWRNNQGHASFAAVSSVTSVTSAAIVAEAFGAGGCMGSGAGRALMPASGSSLGDEFRATRGD